MEKKKCIKCDYVWVARTQDPIECPKCKSRNWQKEKPNQEEAF